MTVQIFSAKKYFLAMLLLSGASIASSEILHGIEYDRSLGWVKTIYPNAKYFRLQPAWLTSDQAFIQVAGDGLPGDFYIAFNDPRNEAKKQTRDTVIEFYRKNSLQVTEELITQHMRVAKLISEQSDDEALTVDWVRWVPHSPIQLQRAEQRYGKAVCGFKEDFRPKCEWPNRALLANMDENKNIISLETHFTKKEIEASKNR